MAFSIEHSFCGQTINLAFSNYNYFVIGCKFSASSTAFRTSTLIFKGITTAMQCGLGGSGSSYYEAYRMVTFNDDNVVFGAGNASNTNAIPVSIYGIK